MRVGVTGPRGRLGSALVGMGFEPMDVDITDAPAVASAASGFDVIINTAAFTAVDECESDSHQEEVIKKNTRGPGILRTSFDGLLIQLSTGFIFDGSTGPYGEDAIPSPVNFYGMSKLGGEAAAMVRQPTLIVRTLDLFGRGPHSDMVRYVRDTLTFGRSVEAPTNQNMTPTFVPHMVEALAWVVEHWPLKWHVLRAKIGERSPLNLAGDATMSRFDWCRTIAEVFGHDKALIVPSDRSWGTAVRPLRGGLLTDRALAAGVPIHSARDGLIALRESENADIGSVT